MVREPNAIVEDKQETNSCVCNRPQQSTYQSSKHPLIDLLDTMTCVNLQNLCELTKTTLKLCIADINEIHTLSN